VADSALGVTLSTDTIQAGLCQETAHSELQEYCHGVDDEILSSIAWLSLRASLDGWLSLASDWQGTAKAIVYLMYAERLVDANDVSQNWFEENLTDADHVKAAMKLLKGKENRISQSTWEWVVLLR